MRVVVIQVINKPPYKHLFATLTNQYLNAWNNLRIQEYQNDNRMVVALNQAWVCGISWSTWSRRIMEEEELLEQRLLTTTTFSRTANDAQLHHWNHKSSQKKFISVPIQQRETYLRFCWYKKKWCRCTTAEGEETELLEN